MGRKADLLQDWFDSVWRDGDEDAIPRLLSATSGARGILPDLSLNRTEVTELVVLIRERLGPIAITLPQVLEQGDWASALIEVHSTAADDGAKIHAFGQIIARFEGDMMVEVYHSFDFLTFFQQMGQMPNNALALLLSGTRLR